MVERTFLLPRVGEMPKSISYGEASNFRHHPANNELHCNQITRITRAHEKIQTRRADAVA
jgi:hypothetical protein